MSLDLAPVPWSSALGDRVTAVVDGVEVTIARRAPAGTTDEMHLMAASPTLLEACAEALALLNELGTDEGDEDPRDIRNLLRDAIMKARGESS